MDKQLEWAEQVTAAIKENAATHAAITEVVEKLAAVCEVLVERIERLEARP